MPDLLIEHLCVIAAVVGLAAFCFSHRDPRNEETETGEDVILFA